jgi:predicted nuclease with TOPRIM domain
MSLKEAMMSELVELTKRQLTEEFEKQKQELIKQTDLAGALEKLQQRYNSLIKQIELLSSANAPADLISWYLKLAGRVWISKKVYLMGNSQEVQVITGYGNHQLMNYQEGPKVPSGLYQLILMVIPQEMPEDAKPGKSITDEYGYTYTVQK